MGPCPNGAQVTAEVEKFLACFVLGMMCFFDEAFSENCLYSYEPRKR